MKAALKLVIAALETGRGTQVEVLVDPSEFGGIHAAPGQILEFDRVATFRVIGPIS